MNEAPEPTTGLLRNRNFLAIWSAQILSQTAANALTAALIVLVYSQTRTNTASSFLILLAIVPAVVFGPLGGVLVDRVDRKLVMIVTNVLRAAGVALLLPLGESVVAAYGVNLVVAAVTVFFVPAEAATLPQIVRKKDLLFANSLFSLTFNGTFVIGFAVLAPLVIALFGFETLFVLLAVMYGLAAILCSLLPRGGPLTKQLGPDVAGEAVAAVTQTSRSLGEAVAYLRSHRRIVWVLVYIALTYMLVAVAGALAPGFVTETLDLSERDMYVLSFPAGLGIILGLLSLNVVGSRLTRPRAIQIGLVTTGVTLFLLAAARPAIRYLRTLFTGGEPVPAFVAIVVVTAFIFGAAYTYITVPSFTLLQEELREEMRGRVFGVLNTLVSVVSLAPLLVIGTVADTLGVGPVFAVAGGAVLGVWVLGRDAHVGEPVTQDIRSVVDRAD